MLASQAGSQKNTEGLPGMTHGLCVSVCSQTSFSPSVPQGTSRKQALSQLSIPVHTHLPGSTFPAGTSNPAEDWDQQDPPVQTPWPDPKSRNNWDRLLLAAVRLGDSKWLSLLYICTLSHHSEVILNAKFLLHINNQLPSALSVTQQWFPSVPWLPRAASCPTPGLELGKPQTSPFILEVVDFLLISLLLFT